MNTESINIDHGTHSSHSGLATQPVSFITAICKKVTVLFIRSELEKAQAGYRQQQRESANHQDIVGSMPLETKLSLGMYRWMD